MIRRLSISINGASTSSRDTIYDILRPPADDEDDKCPGTPFLWKIIEDSTSKHVGFALGTMHLPPSVVTTDKSLASILNAIEDSCDVYAEINLIDDEVLAELEECKAAEPNTAASATVNDVPDEALREAIKAKVTEISIALLPERAEDIASQILAWPLKTVLNMIMKYNTIEYRDLYLEQLRTGKSAMLDTHVLKEGRPSGGLEKVCDDDPDDIITPDMLRANWDAYSVEIKKALDASMSWIIQLYKCGHPETFRNTFAGGCTGSCRYRNIQMATEMNDILKANPNERVFFAVGAMHWRIEPYSMEEVLKVYGYSLGLLESWGNADAPDYSNEQCGVVFDPEKGYYVPDDSVAAETSSTASWMLPNVRSASLSPSATAREVEAQHPPNGNPSSSGSMMGSSCLLVAALAAFLGFGSI